MPFQLRMWYGGFIMKTVPRIITSTKSKPKSDLPAMRRAVADAKDEYKSARKKSKRAKKAAKEARKHFKEMKLTLKAATAAQTRAKRARTPKPEKTTRAPVNSVERPSLPVVAKAVVKARAKAAKPPVIEAPLQSDSAAIHAEPDVIVSPSSNLTPVEISESPRTLTPFGAHSKLGI